MKRLHAITLGCITLFAVAAWLGLARVASAQGASCTPSATQGCLTVTLTGTHKAGASVCIYTSKERTQVAPGSTTQVTGADGITKFKLAPGRYWGRAHKSGNGRSDPGGLAAATQGGVQVNVNSTATPASFSLTGGYTQTCPVAPGSTTGGGTSGSGTTGGTGATAGTTGGSALGIPKAPTAEQARASSGNFSAYNSIYSHPRCTNCHGGVNPATRTNHTTQVSAGGSCSGSSCHATPGWRLASASARFVGKSWTEICNTINQSAQVQSLNAWKEHVEHDPLIAWAFSPTTPQRNPAGPAPKGLAFFKEESLKRYDATAKKLRCAMFTPLTQK